MSGPTRHSVKLPVSGVLPRVGKIRLGSTIPVEGRKDKFGNQLVRPVKADHFVVAEDESGVTSGEAAAAFAAVYGAEPREVHAMLPGHTPDSVMEGAWRLYGAGKLKRRCDGEECSQRTATGWVDGPCQCLADGLAADDREHCTLSYTLQLILPDVAGVGVWQLDTGSEISSRRMADWLTLMATLRGSLAMLEFDLRLVPVSVSPKGQAATVYVLDPQARGETPRQAIQAAQTARQVELPALPVPAADELAEATLDRSGFAEDVEGSAEESPPPDPLTVVVSLVKALDKADRDVVRDAAVAAGQPAMLRAVSAWLLKRYPEIAVEGVEQVVEALRAGMVVA